ncbi:Magnesium transporter MgtE [Geodia barretti]|uniref:Magnesium transporter MgtE n=1 Tax=Geodia barretti TaxID=519541 RepID=A0AA35RAU6_GEOBA|nr:Magnesium transporter MgtE [Geodia barretti]
MLEDLVDEGLTIEAMVRLKRLRIADQAEALVRISTEAQTALLDVLPSEDLGAIIEDLEVEEAVAFCERLAIDKLPVIFDAASPHIAADVLRALEPASAEDVIAEMETAPDVIPLLEYEDDAAGGLMTPEFVALRETMTVEQALDFVRLWAREIGPDPEYLHYLFVVDWEGALKGGLSLAQLVLASRGQFVSLLMDEDIISVGVETDQEEAARLMERYDIFNLPVVDDDGRLVGVVWLDDMIRVLDDEATEDMFRMIGLDQEEKALGPFWRSVRNRLPWLVVNLGTAVLAGYVITLFQSTMGQVVALAAFLPVIAGQGGIAGTQTLTLIIRSITLARCRRRMRDNCC